MKLTDDESRALAFIAALLLLSAAVRLAALPEPSELPTPGDFDIDAHIAATEDAVAEVERRSTPLGEGERLDPNTAAAEELDRLPGVGPAMAEAIVEARGDGRFRSLADLTRVSGIGDRTAERMAPFLTLPERATARPDRERWLGGATGTTGRFTMPAAPVTGTIDLNSADIETLTTLPGVGPVLAARIVEYRESHGPFPAVDSLGAVSGIGPATLARLRPLVRTR